MLQSALKNYKGRRLIIILVQMKKSTSQATAKMYIDEDINFLSQNEKMTSQSATKDYKDRDIKIFSEKL